MYGMRSGEGPRFNAATKSLVVPYERHLIPTASASAAFKSNAFPLPPFLLSPPLESGLPPSTTSKLVNNSTLNYPSLPLAPNSPTVPQSPLFSPQPLSIITQSVPVLSTIGVPPFINDRQPSLRGDAALSIPPLGPSLLAMVRQFLVDYEHFYRCHQQHVYLQNWAAIDGLLLAIKQSILDGQTSFIETITRGFSPTIWQRAPLDEDAWLDVKMTAARSNDKKSVTYGDSCIEVYHGKSSASTLCQPMVDFDKLGTKALHSPSHPLVMWNLTVAQSRTAVKLDPSLC